MRALPRTRLLISFSLSFAVAASAPIALFSACTDETTDNPAAGDATADSSSTAKTDSPSSDDSGSGGDDGDGSVDSGMDAKAVKDANGPGEAGAGCAFNRDCQLALRCECDEATGCLCQPGARGTGKNGVDACDSGNHCESSLCIEGPDPGESICSDECVTKGDCTGKLPRCILISGFPGPICVRQPPQ